MLKFNPDTNLIGSEPNKKRELLFRAFDKDVNKFVYVDIDMEHRYNRGADYHLKTGKILTIYDEYVGYDDLKGRKIYTGDILKSFHYQVGKKKYYLYHKVSYDLKHQTYKAVSLGNSDESLTTHGNCVLWGNFNVEQTEIVGNIYTGKFKLNE